MKSIAKVCLAAVAYFVGVLITGVIAPLMRIPNFPQETGITPEKSLVYMMAATPILAAGLFPIASGLGKSWFKRCLALSGLMFVALGLNTILELTIFSSAKYSFGLCLHFILPSLLASAVLTYSSSDESSPLALRRGSLAGWAGRVTVAWLSFPVIYFLFGLMVAPFVVPVYRAGVADLVIPPLSVIMRMQLLRSALFLAASLPLILLWTRSRRELFLGLGLAHAVTVGIFGLVQAYFLPMVLRVAHSAEITADSFAYAAVLVWAFTQKSQDRQWQSNSAAAD